MINNTSLIQIKFFKTNKLVIMNSIREMVSGKKKRLREGKFNLDLTYIFHRIIAMAYPASGIESTYRNHIDDVI